MLRILSAQDVRQALPMPETIASMKEAFRQLSTGQVEMPLRGRLTIPDQEALALFMPAYAQESHELAIKIVTIFPHNPGRGHPMIYASVLVLDETTGRPLALLEGSTLTAIRTGAAGGASAAVLARPEAKVLAVLGSGVQARTGCEAVCAVRDITEVRIFSPNPHHAQQFAQEMQAKISAKILLVNSPAEAVQPADIVYTATTSTTPTFNGADLRPGTHVIGVGSYTPEMQEVDFFTVQNSMVVVDSRSSAGAEAGELIQAAQAGVTRPEHWVELGEIIAGLKPGRVSDTQITFFKSVGLAAQDVISARLALHQAEKLGLGQLVEF